MIDKDLSYLVTEALPPDAVPDAVCVEPTKNMPGFRVEVRYTCPSEDPNILRFVELGSYEVLGAVLASMLGVENISPTGPQREEDWFPRDRY